MSNTEKQIKKIRRNTRRKFSAEEKIRIVLDGLKGEGSIAELSHREGITQNLYYRQLRLLYLRGQPIYSKHFLGQLSHPQGQRLNHRSTVSCDECRKVSLGKRLV